VKRVRQEEGKEEAAADDEQQTRKEPSRQVPVIDTSTFTGSTE
jgi:hypothetical protein